MAKVSTSGGWSQSSDANLRIWLTEYLNLATTAGLVQTADSGQINLSTVTIPVTNQTLIGYFVLRFDDSLQSTAPIVIKVSLFRGGSATAVNTIVEVGTGSDGAGAITGVKSSISSFNQAGATPGASTYNSYAIHKEGFAALIWKLGGSTSSTAFCNPSFVVQRTVDNTGAPTAEGVHVMSTPINTSATNAYGQCFRLRFLPTTDVGAQYDGNGLGYMPGSVMDSRVNLVPQIFTHWVMLPKQKPLLFTGACLRGEVSVGNQFDLILVGTVPRRYLCVGQAVGGVMRVPTGTAVSDLCILWED